MSIKIIIKIRNKQTSTKCLYHNDNQITINNTHTYFFDQVVTNEDISSDCISLITNNFEKKDITFLTYGQTGSGKTHTLGLSSTGFESNKGIIPRVIDFLHESEKSNDSIENTHSKENTQNTNTFNMKWISFSLFEIYNNIIYDLVDNNNQIKLKGEYFKVKEKKIEIHKIKEILKKLLLNRKTRSTLLNTSSSRSHCILTIKLKNDKNLNFIDLAGSERLFKSGINLNNKKESVNINFNLLCLGNVINALYNRNQYVPFRSCTLTRILKNYFLNNFIYFIACVSDSQFDYGESMYTLEYANRAGNIRIVKKEMNVDQIDEKNVMGNRVLKEENKKLREEINQLKELNVRLNHENERIKEENKRLVQYLQEKKNNIEIRKEDSRKEIEKDIKVDMKENADEKIRKESKSPVRNKISRSKLTPVRKAKKAESETAKKIRVGKILFDMKKNEVNYFENEKK